MDFPGGAGGKEPACQCRRHETQVQPLGQQDPVLLPGESHGQRSLAGYSPWGGKERDTTKATEQTCMHAGHGAPEEEMSSVKMSRLLGGLGALEVGWLTWKRLQVVTGK